MKAESRLPGLLATISICFQVKDLEAAMRELREKNAVSGHPVYRWSSGCKFATKLSGNERQ